MEDLCRCHVTRHGPDRQLGRAAIIRWVTAWPLYYQSSCDKLSFGAVLAPIEIVMQSFFVTSHVVKMRRTTCVDK